MSTKNIYFIERRLEHKGIEPIQNDSGIIYKVKEGYSLPLTAYKMTPNLFFGYTKNKIECELPENSIFKCSDKYCRNIESSAIPVIDKETVSGLCFGKGCMENDWECMNEYRVGAKIYEL